MKKEHGIVETGNSGAAMRRKTCEKLECEK